MEWDPAALADRLAQVVQQAEQALQLEQAVHGLDVKDEREFQSLLATGLEAFYSVAREVHYPSTVGRKLTHRPRSDLVLSPRGRALQLTPQLPLFSRDEWCAPADALWIEVKVAAQFRTAGVRHRRYGAQWRSGVVRDLQKMQADPSMVDRAMVLIVFNESEEILRKDLELFESVLAQAGVLTGLRHVSSVGVTDRIGHRLCTVALWRC